MKFLSALAADGTIPDVEGIISSNLSAGFDSLKENVSESIARQEKILAAVQVGEIFNRCGYRIQQCKSTHLVVDVFYLFGRAPFL